MKAKKQETAATMKDVALKAKVSTATVSRALMNPDKVSQATRNRVKKRPGKWVIYRSLWGATSSVMNPAPFW
ncbi:DNA-binding transcriptional regulator CytR [Escherichia coli]|uniref:DNA-binding transcriptional regulator CytR n=1 Tax=Escherichia coli TaxID=562 RepID=A0A377BRS3_ECOLX|nr:DNA-binding transcriptional regulator CytR [Escherichia coli]